MYQFAMRVMQLGVFGTFVYFFYTYADRPSDPIDAKGFVAVTMFAGVFVTAFVTLVLVKTGHAIRWCWRALKRDRTPLQAGRLQGRPRAQIRAHNI